MPCVQPSPSRGRGFFCAPVHLQTGDEMRTHGRIAKQFKSKGSRPSRCEAAARGPRTESHRPFVIWLSFFSTNKLLKYRVVTVHFTDGHCVK